MEKSIEVDMVGVTITSDNSFEIVADDGHIESFMINRVTGLKKGDTFHLSVQSLPSLLAPEGIGVEVTDLSGKAHTSFLKQAEESGDLVGTITDDERRVSVHVWPSNGKNLKAPKAESDKDRVLVFIFDMEEE